MYRISFVKHIYTQSQKHAHTQWFDLWSIPIDDCNNKRNWFHFDTHDFDTTQWLNGYDNLSVLFVFIRLDFVNNCYSWKCTESFEKIWALSCRRSVNQLYSDLNRIKFIVTLNLTQFFLFNFSSINVRHNQLIVTHFQYSNERTFIYWKENTK